jgi:hypothetical protein
MSELLTYDVNPLRSEVVTGTIVGSPFAFVIVIGNGEDKVIITEIRGGLEPTQSIEVEGGWFDAIVAGLTEVAALRHEADKRVAS